MSKKRTKISRSLALSLLFTGTGAAVSLFPPAAYAAITGTVQGTVRGEDGRPLANARVFLIGAGTPPQARTDSRGGYTFTGVQPGAYTLRTVLASYETSEVTVQVVQDITSTIDFSLNKVVLRRKGTVFVSPIRLGDPSTTTPITKRDEQQEKSQPNNLYQSTGLLNYKPGVTVDSGQYPHLRGSDQNQIDYLVDGISVRDPIFNEFQTNLVTVGIQTSNVQTAGQDASYGGATGGYLNQITSNGRDLKGGTVEGTFGPAHLWRYKGNRFEYGNITPDNKFDYTISNINFSNYFGANTQLGKLNSSTDTSLKLNYYGAGNTFTLYGHHGAEDYYTYDSTNPGFSPSVGVTNGENLKFGFGTTGTGVNPKTKQPVTFATSAVTDQYQLGHTLQTDNEVYGQVRHNFTTKSYLTYRLFNLHQHTPGHSENINNVYTDYYATKTGNQLDYYSDLNRNLVVRAGYLHLDGNGTHYRTISGVNTPLLTTGNKRYTDRTYGTKPLENDLYLSGTVKTTDSKLTADLGLRYGNTKYRLVNNGNEAALFAVVPGQLAPPNAYTKHYLDPRLGATYSPDKLTVFRTSYSVNSQFAETRFIQNSSPIETGYIGTALDPLAQFRAAHLTRLGYNNLGPYHSNDFDLGVERAFRPTGLLGGTYSVNLTGYKKKQYDLIEQDQPSFDTANFTTVTLNGASVQASRLGYVNTGHGHSSGVEFSLRKVRVRPSDWSGYVNYTNQVVRATDSFADTTYSPYFAAFQGGNNQFFDARTGNPNGLPAANDYRRLNQLEFPTGYDQRHTVAVVVNKSFFKFVENSFILDAGSGYPFFSGGAAADGTFGIADSQHGELGTSLGGSSKADFSEVPFVDSTGGAGIHASPIGVIAGRSSWHYKVAVNSTFHLTPSTSLFLNVDNIFDKKTILNFSPSTFSGQPYFAAPTAAFPQGKIIYGSQTVITPVFLTFGFQQKF